MPNMPKVTIEPARYGQRYVVCLWGKYLPGTARAGQTRKVFMDAFSDLDEARFIYPEAKLITADECTA